MSFDLQNPYGRMVLFLSGFYEILPVFRKQLKHFSYYIPGLWAQESDARTWTLDSGRWTLDVGL